MAIYDLGTASLSANGEVTGVGTTWKAPLTLIRVGATIIFKTNPLKIYTISEIISDTQINVYNPNSETVPAGTGYAILAHDGITVQGLAQDVAETLRYYQSKETSIESLLQFIGQDTFDWPRFEQLAKQSTTGAAEALASQIAAAESASTAVSARDATRAARDATIEAINSAGDAGTLVTLANLGIATKNIPFVTTGSQFDWQTYMFKSGESLYLNPAVQVNAPAGMTFPVGVTRLYVHCTGARNNAAYSVTVSASNGNNNNYRTYNLQIDGATGSRVFTPREVLTIPGGDTGGGGSSAIRVRGLLDVYSKSETFQKSLNFSDVANKSAARTNLDVYSKAEVDSGFNMVNGYIPSGSFSEGVDLLSNYQSFTYNGNQFSYIGTISPGMKLPASPDSDSNWVLTPISSKLEAYGGGVHVLDNKDAIIKAIYAGVKVLELPAGEIRTSEVVLNGAAAGITFLGKGGNQAYLGSTRIVPATSGQVSIFRSMPNVSGVDAIKFKGISFDGRWDCRHGILQESGGGWEYSDLSGNGFNTWFIYSGQGLSRMRRIYCNATDISDTSLVASGGGIRVYSDSVLDSIEVYGGSVPLRLSAGGNRCNNIFCNGGRDVGAIILEPQDVDTNHINTALSNIYIGETTSNSSSAVPILSIKGNSVRKVSGVQICNAHFVHAMTNIESNMVCIRAENAERIVMSSFDALGKGAYSTPTSRTLLFMDAYNTTSIAMSSGVINGMNGHAIRLTDSTCTIDSTSINDWATNPASEEFSAIRTIGGSSRIAIGSSIRFNNQNANAYAIQAENEYTFDAPLIMANYPSSTLIMPVNANYSYAYKRPGGKITYVNTYQQ